MGLSLGDGIALASMALVLLGIIIKYQVPKNGHAVCSEHSGFAARILALESRINEIDEKLDRHHQQLMNVITDIKINGVRHE